MFIIKSIYDYIYILSSKEAYKDEQNNLIGCEEMDIYVDAAVINEGGLD